MARFDGSGGAESEGREGLEGQLGLSGVRGRARDDEASGKGVDLVESQGGVEWRWEWGLLVGGADVGAVAGLDGQDGAGGCEVVLVGDAGSSSEVGADSDTLEDTGKCDERLGVGGGEGVGALGDGCVLESAAEEGDVGGLVVGDLLQVGVEWVGETGCDEVGLGVVGKTLTVELVLEMLEGKSVVKDTDCGIRSACDLCGCGNGEHIPSVTAPA